MMRFADILEQPADWMRNEGPHSDIVVTSRVRLARNLQGHVFPGWSDLSNREEVAAIVSPQLEKLKSLNGGFRQSLSGLENIQKQVLVERHLISREHAAKDGGCSAVMDKDQNLSIMVNEEDHLRMQAIYAGLNLSKAYSTVNQADSALCEDLDFAYDAKLGFLTSCPTNLGTGIRASAMLHLPALVIAGQINPVINAVNKIGLAVRGIYGEGTEALANLFQVSNQNTLGEKEEEIIARLERVIEQIVDQERNARLKLQEDNVEALKDKIGRAYATLRHAHIIASKEALEHLSMLRLGCDLGVFPVETRSLVDILFTETQPAHLQIAAGSRLSAQQRDCRRAEILRDKLKKVPSADMLKLSAFSSTASEITDSDRKGDDESNNISSS